MANRLIIAQGNGTPIQPSEMEHQFIH